MVKIGVRLRKLLSQIKTEYHFLDHPLDCVLMFFFYFFLFVYVCLFYSCNLMRAFLCVNANKH